MKKYGFDRVESMCSKAKRLGMGIVVEFNGGLFTESDIYVKRLNETIDALEQKGVYGEQTALAYYEDGSIVRAIHLGKYKTVKTTKEQLLSIKKVMDRLAQHIVDRQPKTYFPTGNQQQPTNSNSNGDSDPTNDWRNPDYWHF